MEVVLNQKGLHSCFVADESGLDEIVLNLDRLPDKTNLFSLINWCNICNNTYFGGGYYPWKQIFIYLEWLD